MIRAVFVFGGRKKDFNTENTEGPRRPQRREKSRDVVAVDRKSPPLQTKGGAPSSSFVRWRDRRMKSTGKSACATQLSVWVLFAGPLPISEEET